MPLLRDRFSTHLILLCLVLLLLGLALALPAAALAAAGWSTQLSSTTQDLVGVACVPNTSDVWAVGWQWNSSVGLIYATTNGGTNWKAQSLPTGYTAPLNAVAFANSSDGWAVGEGGEVLCTTNGGAAWTGQYSGTVVDLLGVACFNAKDAWAVGLDGTIDFTTNGGTTWTGLGQGGGPRACWCRSRWASTASPSPTQVMAGRWALTRTRSTASSTRPPTAATPGRCRARLRPGTFSASLAPTPVTPGRWARLRYGHQDL